MIALWLTIQIVGADTGTVATALRATIEMPRHAEMRWGDIRDVLDAVRATYVAGDWRPLWSAGRHLTAPGSRLLDELDSAQVRGLDPKDYDTGVLHDLLAAVSTGSAEATAEFDVILSVAALRFGKDLAQGRANSAAAHPLLHTDNPATGDPSWLGRLARTSRPDSLLRDLEPTHVTYLRLLDALAEYRRIGTPPDSVVRRIRQIELALERWRWLPHSASAPWVLINVPAFRLYAAVTDHGVRQDMLEMDVVVGRAAGHPTPVLVTSIVAVEFHPWWIVPPSIARHELRPQALRNAAFLARQHYQLFRRDSAVAASRETIEQIGEQVEVRQVPGPWNVLGAVKFVTPNGADIYLHDTPARDAFRQARRDASHGCIRLEDPGALAAFVLDQGSTWDVDRIEAELVDDTPRLVTLRRPIRVFVVYQTLVPDRTGGLIAYSDIYGLDRQLDALMRADYAAPLGDSLSTIAVHPVLH